MIYLCARYHQRGESYAYEESMPHTLYRICSQPETMHDIRFKEDDRIIFIGDVPDRLWDMVDLLAAKSSAKPKYERVWLS